MGQKLRDFRQSKGRNQEEFAQLLGINRSYLSEVETGAVAISSLLREKIERILNGDNPNNEPGVCLSGSVLQKALRLVELLKFDDAQELVEHLIRVEFERIVPTQTSGARDGSIDARS